MVADVQESENRDARSARSVERVGNRRIVIRRIQEPDAENPMYF
jgi:hypothetical protein